MVVLLMDVCGTLSHWGPRKTPAANASLPRGRGRGLCVKSSAVTTFGLAVVVDQGVLTSYL